jgi:hypothetical protein
MMNRVIQIDDVSYANMLKNKKKNIFEGKEWDYIFEESGESSDDEGSDFLETALYTSDS